MVISVLLPVYNAEKYLGKTIESVLAQSYKNIELIIINDGSNDNSINIINKYAIQDKRIKLFDRENHGLVRTLNQGIELSSGEYIARIDADDICDLNRFEKQIKKIKNTDSDVCGCNYIAINKYDNEIYKKEYYENDDLLTFMLINEVPFPHPGVLIRKSFLKNYNLKYDENFSHAEDYKLWIDMKLKGAKFCNVNEYLLKYRVFPESKSNKNFIQTKIEAKMLSNYFIKNHRVILIKLLFSKNIYFSYDVNKYIKNFIKILFLGYK